MGRGGGKGKKFRKKLYLVHWTNYTRTMMCLHTSWMCVCKHVSSRGRTALYTIQKENGKQISLCKNASLRALEKVPKANRTSFECVILVEQITTISRDMKKRGKRKMRQASFLNSAYNFGKYLHCAVFCEDTFRNNGSSSTWEEKWANACAFSQ